MKFLTQWQAAELLASFLKGDAKKWYGFLTKNSRNHSSQDHGYKITPHVENGKLAYTREALLEFVRVSQTPHKAGALKVPKASDETDYVINEIVLNIINENDGDFDLQTKVGIDEVSSYAADYYSHAGIKIKASDIKRELRRKIREFKALDLM